MLAADKRGLGFDQAVREGAWWQVREQADTIELYEKTFLMVGFGRIGSLVAPRASAFGMEAMVCDPYISPEMEARLAIVRGDLDQVLQHADILVVQVPHTPSTEKIIGAREL